MDAVARRLTPSSHTCVYVITRGCFPMTIDASGPPLTPPPPPIGRPRPFIAHPLVMNAFHDLIAAVATTAAAAASASLHQVRLLCDQLRPADCPPAPNLSIWCLSGSLCA
uniref:Uncharacterized protein n=1 Tax=Plectus sambesii TaxID=2011161 RepID=A0A914WCY0_9BILA